MKFEEFERNIIAALNAAIESEGSVEVELPDNSKTVSIISTENLNSLYETLHVLTSPDNAKHLSEALNEIREGNLHPQTLQELMEEIEG